MTETTQLSGKIKHKCSKTMLLTPQELFELDRCIESLRASGSFTETTAHSPSRASSPLKDSSSLSSLYFLP